MKDFDLDKLERKNIYKTPDDLFKSIQDRVLSEVNDFDLENLERKNIYTVPENMFANVQERVLSEITAEKKAPIFKLNWGYAAAASLALIFGSTFLYNSYSEKDQDTTNTYTKNDAPKNESEIAYETLKSDLTSVEKNNQTNDNQQIKTVAYIPDNKEVKQQAVKPTSKKTEAQMTEYLDSFTNSEIEELANNSSQDVYLDLYN